MMTTKNPDWKLKIDLSNFFLKHSELRARNKKTLLADTIHLAVFESTLKKQFNQKDISEALRDGLLGATQIKSGGTLRNVYMWLPNKCQTQVVFYKEWWKKVKDYFSHLVSDMMERYNRS